MYELKRVISSRLQKAIQMRGINENKKALFGDRYYYWIHGKTVPDTENIIRICEILEISADWLLGISDKEPMWLFYRGNNMYRTCYGERGKKYD